MQTAEFWTLIKWLDAKANVRRTTVETTGAPITPLEAKSFIEPTGVVFRVESGQG